MSGSARAITATELGKQRSDGQWSRLKLAIFAPATIYTARINQATFDNPLTELTYDGGSGTLSDVRAGYTLLVGSTAGGFDHGIARLRKEPVSPKFYLGETSELTPADNDYLTVLRETALWPRHLRIVGTTAQMDYDVAYSDQHATLDPYPVLGPDQVLYLPAGGTVNASFSASDSWCLGSSISSYDWSAPGASATANLTTATPIITYNAAGTYIVRCTVTAANGKTARGYRQVLVYSDAAPLEETFTFDECEGDYDEGGFSAKITLSALTTTIRPYSKAAIVAEDIFNGAVDSQGPISGRENILFLGQIDGQTIQYDQNAGTVQFVLQGPHLWLKSMQGFPVGMDYTASDPTAWTQLKGLTVNRAVWHVLHWRTTASLCMDAYLTEDTKILPTAESTGDSLWKQIATIASKSILAKPVTDRYGRFFCFEETQFLPADGRTGIPTVMDITDNDITGTVNIERVVRRAYSQAELSGIRDDTSEPIITRAMGGVYTRYGAVESVENLLFDNQAAANVLSGNYFAWLNNEFPFIDLALGANNRFIDIAPRQRVTLSLSASRNPLGITWSSKPLLPLKVRFDYDHETGFLSTSLTCAAETSSTVPGVTVEVDIPAAVGNSDISIEIPDFNDTTWPSLTPGMGYYTPPDYTPLDPLVPPVSGATCPADAPANGPYRMAMSGIIGPGNDFNDDFNSDITAAFSAVIRTSGHSSPTTYELRGLWEKYDGGTETWAETSDDSFYVVEAVSAGGVVVGTGIHDAVTNLRVRTGVINAAAASAIAFIRVRLIETSMPDIVTAVGWSWDLYPIGAGTLSWGVIEDRGIWASHQNIIKEGVSRPYPTAGGGSRITVGDDGRLNGRWTQVKHTGNVMMESEYSGTSPHYTYVRTPAEGNIYGSMKWQQTIVNDTYFAYNTGEQEFIHKLGATAPDIGLQINALAPSGSPSWKMTYNHYMSMIIIPQYRMTVGSSFLSNVCPISA